MAIDWQIAQTWAWPVVARLGWMGATLLAGWWLMDRGRAELTAVTAAASFYGVPVVAAIIRWHLHPGGVALIGDGAFQTAIAGNLLLRGIDPYGYDYTRTPLANAPWGQPFPNPALHHLVYWPGTVLLPLPFQAAAQALSGFWDARLFLLGAAVAVFYVVCRLLGGRAGWAAAALIFLLPGHALYAILGDNDMAMLALLLGSLLAARRRAFPLAGVLLGLALATKQTALVATPLAAAWILAQRPDRRNLRWCVVAAAGSTAILVLPFVVWNPGAFWADTVRYSLGSGQQSYPIQGIGVGSLLLHLGVIHGPRDAFPFVALQAAVVLPTWVAGWRWIRSHGEDAGLLLVWLAAAFFGLLAFNRFFQPTYLVLSLELALAGLVGRSWGSLPGGGRRLLRDPAAA